MFRMFEDSFVGSRRQITQRMSTRRDSIVASHPRRGSVN